MRSIRSPRLNRPLDEARHIGADEQLVLWQYPDGETLHAAQGAVEATPENLVTLVNLLPEGTIFNCCAIGRAQIPITTMAVLLGGQARVGMEDNIYYSKGVLAKNNAEMVAKSVRIIKDLGYEIATPQEAREIIGLPKV